MAKSFEYNKAQGLRKRGKSIRDIARILSVAKSTVSLWCRDIELTQEQLHKLQENKLKGGYAGRMKGARIQYEKRIQKDQTLELEGKTLLGSLTKRDFFMAGLGVYWGEGTKYGRQAGVSNSDPLIVKFCIKWFKEVFHFDDSRFKLYILINEIHRKRLKKVLQYWVSITGIPKESFGKITLIKAKNKKSYNNFHIHYGTVRINIRRPMEIHHKIMGMLKEVGKSV